MLPFFPRAPLKTLNFQTHSDITEQHHNEEKRLFIEESQIFQFIAIASEMIDEEEDQSFHTRGLLALIGLESGWLSLLFSSTETKKRRQQSRKIRRATTDGSLDNKLTFQEMENKAKFFCAQKKD